MSNVAVFYVNKRLLHLTAFNEALVYSYTLACLTGLCAYVQLIGSPAVSVVTGTRQD